MVPRKTLVLWLLLTAGEWHFSHLELHRNTIVPYTFGLLYH